MRTSGGKRYREEGARGVRRAPSSRAGKTLRGTIRTNAKRFGFVAAAGREEDIFIEGSALNTALNGDTVEIALLPRPVRGPGGMRSAGRVVKVVRRAREEFVGTIERRERHATVVLDDRRAYTPFAIAGETPPGTATGVKALVRFARWTDPRKLPEASIIELIGKKGEHEVEMRAIVLEHGFRREFPPAAETEAAGFKANEARMLAEELAKRRDFRLVPTVTIDPLDAKDFDDALSLSPLPDGRLEAGVHIADVSYFVREGSVLDREARRRGTSVYLVDRTIPMLPEILSNDLASLNPGEDKLAFSAVFTLDRGGAVLSRSFGRSVIRSAKRFTYEEAQATLDAGGGPFFDELSALNGIAEKLREEKLRAGAIDFEQDEVRFELDAAGRPLRVYKKARLATHKLVEEWMLLANREVAEFIFRARAKRGSREPFIYRVHDLPDSDKIRELALFVRALGYELPVRNGTVSPKDLQALLAKLTGKAEESLVKTAAIRAMAKAAYSTKNIGHFGLAFEYYTHFTSPIRRYPDLLVHRLLEKHLRDAAIPPHEFAEYEAMALETSEREIEAAEAERESVKLKQTEFMAKRLGQTFKGVVSGVTEWGLYVEERDTKSEGMLRLRDLRDDHYELDEKNYRIVGKRSGKTYTLGDRVRFRVAAADPERKLLEYGGLQKLERPGAGSST